MNETIPPATARAARRGFIRTTAQAYAASIPVGGISAAALASVVTDPDPVVIATSVVAALLSPLLAGAASALSILAKGIPEDYQA